MDDPWDVKSVRQPGQYISCMKISGVPLLPPVLSKECRKEMQYYKLLAKEVEKRISLLQPLMFDNSFDSEDITDAPELPEYEQGYELLQGDVLTGSNKNIDKIKTGWPTQTASGARTSPISKDNSNIVNNTSPLFTASNFIIDLSLSINETGRKVLDTSHKAHSTCIRELPERDYNQITKKEIIEKEVIFELNGTCNETNNFEDNSCVISSRGLSSDTLSGIPLSQEGPSSLSSKSFTGSLNDIHSQSIKASQVESSKLVRQSSYTLLHPSPHLLAHLEIHARDKGIAMNLISMSESLSDVVTPIKKRKGWDLQTAKEKWSKMALELKEKNVIKNVARNTCKTAVKQPVSKQINQPRAKSVVSPPHKKNNLNSKTWPKSEVLSRTKRQTSPLRNSNHSRTMATEPLHKDSGTQIHGSTESEDPAIKVRELYEKIQSQQLAQMTSLLEKQKKEQMLLQQVFEEQNNLLFKQLKIICPKSPIEAKEAWSDKLYDGNRGPVSLSQLIHHKSPDKDSHDSSISSTLTDTNRYINHCDSILQKSRDISGSIKNELQKSQSHNGTKIQSPKTHTDGNITRTHSPVRQSNNISRQLTYDTSMSSEQNEPLLTDRTNDTMADLNVTFPSDPSDEFKSKHFNSNLGHIPGKESDSSHRYAGQSNNVNSLGQPKSLENTIKRCTHKTVGLSRITKTSPPKSVPTPKERAAATKIVAHVKGYLVRRLMRTERVQGIVQTIKDALLCALQLHQDREGIRGADVDLHRRLIQQITAACYSLHDTFVASTSAERCAMIAADRGRRRSLAARQPNHTYKQTDVMSQSHSGTFPARAKRTPPSLMTQSNYETFSGEKSSRYPASPRRRPWR